MKSYFELSRKEFRKLDSVNLFQINYSVLGNKQLR